MLEPIHEERREGYIELDNKMDAVIGMIRVHMQNEQEQIQEIKRTIDQYFSNITPEIHKQHHDTVASNIKAKEVHTAMFNNLVKGVLEKILLTACIGLAMYIGKVVWTDIKQETHPVIHERRDTEPKQIQQAPAPVVVLPPPRGTTAAEVDTMHSGQ